MLKSTHCQQILFKVSAVALGLLVFTVGLELSMRFTGWTIIETQSYGNQSPDFTDPKEIRIITLGESTTAQLFSERAFDSWPRQLQTELNKKFSGFNFKVFNLAVPAINTSQILMSLTEKYDGIKPALVISMMGINDTSYIDIADSNVNVTRNLRITKLYHYLRDSFSRPPLACGRFENQEEIYSAVYSVVKKREEQFNGLFDTYADKFKDNLPYLNMFIGDALYGQAGQLMINCSGECLKYVDKLYAQSFDFLQKTLADCPTEPLALKIFLFNSHNVKKESLGAKAIKDALAAGYTPDEETFGHIMTFAHPNDPEDPILQYSRKKSFLITTGRAYLMTKKNYLRLAEFTKSKGVIWAVMSYPTTKVESMMNLFNPGLKESYANFYASLYDDRLKKDVVPEKYNDFYFVTNENFSEYVGKSTYSEYFTDNFCFPNKCKFGHTTTLGHAKITQNILEQLSPLFNELVYGQQKK